MLAYQGAPSVNDIKSITSGHANFFLRDIFSHRKDNYGEFQSFGTERVPHQIKLRVITNLRGKCPWPAPLALDVMTQPQCFIANASSYYLLVRSRKKMYSFALLVLYLSTAGSCVIIQRLNCIPEFSRGRKDLDNQIVMISTNV